MTTSQATPAGAGPIAGASAPAADSGPRPPGGWPAVIGTLAIVAALWAARDVLVPIALAALLAFLMSPAVARLERLVGRVPAVLGTVMLAFALAAAGGWTLLHQLDGIAGDLPAYRTKIASRIDQVRALGRGGTVEELQKTVEKVQQDLADATTPPRAARVVVAEGVGPSGGLGVLGPMVGLAATAGLVVTLVIFMLLERRDLRDRIVGIVGRGHVARTTRALEEAGRRVARQLLMQSLVNAIYAAITATGLWALGVPYPAVWGVLGGLLRFVPYVGPLVGVTAPVLVALAALDGWREALYVLGFMVLLELFTNLVLETVLYAGAAGVSQVGLLVAVTFWTWLWGPMGLLLAIPLTVCVVVIGKHVRGLEYLATLMADTPVASPPQVFYQRLLASDTGDAIDLIEKHVASSPPRSVYDALVLPALAQAEADRLDGRLDAEAQRVVTQSAGELLADTADEIRRVERAKGAPAAASTRPVLRVLGYGVGGPVDRVALAALAHVVDDLPIAVEAPPHLLSGELAEWAVAHGHDVVCLADLPPSSSSRTRYLVRRLRERAPGLTVIVGRWTSSVSAEDLPAITAAGAHHVAVSLEQSRAFLQSLLAAAPAERREAAITAG